MHHFPQASFVVVWRQPVETIASLLSLFEEALPFLDEPTADANAHHLMANCYHAVLTLRKERADDPRFVFLPFEQWRDDPPAQLARICAAHGLRACTADDSVRSKTEGHLPAANAARLRQRAIAIVRAHWQTHWQDIFTALDFEVPAQ